MPRSPDTYHARKLRQLANAPEQKAWAALRTLRDQGYPVRRQHPIGGYFVDFAIIRAKLVIEIDGSIHNVEAVRLADASRQADIERHGWRVIRIDAETALSADHVLAIVCAELGID